MTTGVRLGHTRGMPTWTTLFDRRGFQARLVARTGLKKQTVNGWRDGIPIAYCAAVEEECGGEFTRRDFRPDDWRTVWPELAKASTAEQEA